MEILDNVVPRVSSQISRCRDYFKYETKGRYQTEEKAKAIDEELEKILKLHNIDYHTFISDESNISSMIHLIVTSL